jgi:HEAT repeat protein
MRSGTPSKKKHIAQVLAPDELLVTSKLSHLSNLDEADLEFFKQSWERTSEGRKRQVISQLVHLGQTNFRLDFSSIFLFCLSDPDSMVRADAIAGLAEEEDYRYISPLVSLLKGDSSAGVREAAIVALGKFALVGELRKLSYASTNKVYQALLTVLDDSSAGDKLHCLALEAIAPLSLPRVKELIEKAYRSSNLSMKTCALRAMGHNCDMSWLTILIRELGSDNAKMRYAAVQAIGEIGSDEALPYLIQLSRDKDTQVQEAAIKGLGEIGGETARETLNRLIRSPQPRVRKAAKAAMSELNVYEEPSSRGS